MATPLDALRTALHTADARATVAGVLGSQATFGNIGGKGWEWVAAGYFIGGIYWATGLIMAATLISTILARILLGEMTPTRVATAILVLGFGGLTLWLSDPRFIKIKPTAINLLFAAVLFGGVLTGKPLLAVAARVTGVLYEASTTAGKVIDCVAVPGWA